MEKLSQLRVKDMLKRDYFQSAEVVAGYKGLSRTIKWAHIMEVTEIGQLLNGNEVILSTGVGWKEESLSLSFLQQLIDHGVSALCVELGTYIDNIPGNMISLANQNSFPLIVFNQEVRFIDITQDINGLLTGSQDKMMSELESYSNQINRLLLSTDGFNKILWHLRKYLGMQVIYMPVDGKAQFYPGIEKTNEDKLIKEIQYKDHRYNVKKHPIKALGYKFADLMIVATRVHSIDDFESLVLDRTATALAQEQLRILYVKEKRKYQGSPWVEKWLDGELRIGEIEQHLSSIEPSLKPNGCVVCTCKVDLSKIELDHTYFSMIFRSIFEEKGFFLLTTYKFDQIVFILINKRTTTDWKKRLQEALEKIQETELVYENVKTTIYFAIGKLYGELHDVNYSYQRAQETMQIQKKIGKMDFPFYEDLHVYRILSQMYREEMIEEFVIDYLKPVLEFDHSHNAQLFETLEVYLKVQGSKKEAANRLFIVRQTLYHRIDKLKELLGDDFMEPEKRLALEIAVYAKRMQKQV